MSPTILLAENALRPSNKALNSDRFESLKANFSLILFVYNLMIEYSKKNIKNFLRKCF